MSGVTPDINKFYK